MVRERCDAAYNDTAAMRLRMMADWNLYRLAPFRWREIIAERIPEKTATMTSNEPRTLADTVASLLIGAPVTYRAPTANEVEDIRDAGRAVEELFHGLLTMADKMRPLMVQPPIKHQLVGHMLIRGFLAGMHLLTKDEQGNTVPQIEIWDPLNVYWGVSTDGGNTGQNHQGLAWACHYQDLDSWRLDSRFGDGRNSITGGLAPTYYKGKNPIYRVYDFYNREFNIVVVDDKVIDKRRHFGQGYVPVTIVPVGPMPLIIDAHATTAYVEDFGASIYAHNRDLYPKLNALLSVKYERVLRYVNPAVATKSRSGRYVLPPNVANPFERGQRFRQSTANDEEILALEEPELTRDAAELEGAMQAQLQKGGVPNVTHGQQNAPSSGYNTSLLLQSNRHVLEPRLDAIVDWYESCEEFLRRQFASGLFEPMKLQGEIDRRRPYNRLIEPSVIRSAPAPVFKCRIKNPSEIAQRMSLAQMLKQLNFADTHYILDEVLEIEDPDGMIERLALENAKMALPQTQLYEAIKAAEEAGDLDIAKLLYAELLKYIDPMASPMAPTIGPGQSAGQLPPGSTPSPGATTSAGGSPRSGQPNPSDESQQQGRPRDEGVR